MSAKTTRRAVLAGSAAVAATPLASLPALTAEPDPIFAAIERHRRLQTKVNEICDSPEPLEDDVVTPIFSAADRALADILATTPTTLAGCAAMLFYVQAWFNKDCIADDASDSCPFSDWAERWSKPGETLFGRLAETIEREAGKAVAA